MATETLRERLGLSDEEIDRLADAGMPTDDPLRSLGWLVEQGRLIPPRVVSLKGLAEYFQVVPLTIKNWSTQGLPVLADGRFDLDEAVRWRLAHIRKSPEANRLAQAKASRAELDLRERLNEVAPVEPLHRRMVRRIGEAKAILNQLPDAVAASAVEAGVSRELAGRLREQAETALHRALRAVADLAQPPAQDDEASTPEE